MNAYLVLVLLLLSTSQGGVWAKSVKAAPDVAMVGEKLKQFCRACHGVGDQRFLWSESNQEIWDYIFHEKAPKSQKLWKDGIIEVLDWPSDVPPAFSQFMDPPNRDWMPKGEKRILLSRDSVGASSTRRFLLEQLRWPSHR